MEQWGKPLCRSQSGLQEAVAIAADWPADYVDIVLEQVAVGSVEWVAAGMAVEIAVAAVGCTSPDWAAVLVQKRRAPADPRSRSLPPDRGATRGCRSASPVSRVTVRIAETRYVVVARGAAQGRAGKGTMGSLDVSEVGTDREGFGSCRGEAGGSCG